MIVRILPLAWRASAPSVRLAAAALLLACAVSPAVAQADPGQFPAAAARFLDTELPSMNAAVAAQDRGYFEGAMARAIAFAEQWDFKTRSNPALAGYGACTAAVSDYVVVGLCKLTPGASDCTPAEASGFERNVADCRALAGR